MRERLQKDLGIINSFLGRLLVAIPLAILSMWFAGYNEVVEIDLGNSEELMLGIKMVVFLVSWLVVLWLVDVVLFGFSQIGGKRPSFGYWLNSLTKIWKVVILFVLAAYSLFTFVMFYDEIPHRPKIFVEDAEMRVAETMTELATRNPEFFKYKEVYKVENFIEKLYSVAYSGYDGLKLRDERFLMGTSRRYWADDLAECFLKLLGIYSVFIITLKLFHFRWQRKMEQIAT